MQVMVDFFFATATGAAEVVGAGSVLAVGVALGAGVVATVEAS